MESEYLYYPSEFPDPPVKVRNIAITFSFESDGVVVSEETTFEVKRPNLTELKLNAKNLIIISIKQNNQPIRKFTYQDDILTVPLKSKFNVGEQFRISTVTRCYPTDNILEGLYYDYAPENGPRTIISQCQQWGFQRFAPCIDDMRMKCTWKTTIIADNRYLNLISNGNISSERTRYDRSRDIITYVNPEPMPPYLFFIGVGTWDTYSRDFIYPDGKKIRLELLALPGSEKKDAETALDIMADAILWTHIFTGPEKYENIEERQNLYNLCLKRYLSGNSTEYDDKISQYANTLVMGYQYPYEVYREISMQNSDFGGMENTGNTTIIASRILPGSELSDASYEYLFGVKQHEFYHNLNGSGVTGDTPFSIWLNEAVTVMMEDDYLAFHFGKDYIRLCTLMQIYAPGTGTFSLDTGALSMPIEPVGFNDPNDLITSVTYVKAPEFTRMIEASLGKRAFAWALDLYHTKYAGKNASPSDWLRVMEEIGKTDFSFMADRWLKETGYPRVTATAKWNEESKTADITVTQRGFPTEKPWIFPFTGKLLDENGEVITEFSHRIDSSTLTFQVPCPKKISNTIWNLNHAAYICMENNEPNEVLYRQLKIDISPVTKFTTFLTLYEREMIRLLKDKNAEVSPEFIDAFMEMLNDYELTESCGVLPMTMFEAVSDSDTIYSYTNLYEAKKKILQSIAQKYEQQLRTRYNTLEMHYPEGFAPDELSTFFKRNAVKNLILTLLGSLDTPDAQLLAKHQYNSTSNATARLVALSIYLSSSARDRMTLLEKEMERCASNPVAFENFIASVAGTYSPETVDYLKIIEKSPSFHKEHAGFSRSLYLRFAQNRKLSLETEKGREFLESSIQNLAEVNSYITTGILSVFSQMNVYEPRVREELIQMLRRLEAGISPEKAPAVYQTVKLLLDKIER